MHQMNLRRYTRSDDVVVSDLGDGTSALMNPRNGKLYSLNSVGAFLWARLDCAQSVEELSDLLVTEFGVCSEVAGTDVQAFLKAMNSLGLIRTEPVDG